MRDDCRLQRMAVYRKKVPSLKKHKLAFVVRITDIEGVSQQVMQIFKTFRLGKMFSGSFVKRTAEILKMLQFIEPYVAWGFPNLKSVRELILKRLQGKVNSKKVALTDNTMSQKELGKFGIICLEDVIHELYSAGEHFMEVNKFLHPSVLSIARHAGINRKGYPSEVGDPGHRVDAINDLIQKPY